MLLGVDSFKCLVDFCNEISWACKFLYLCPWLFPHCQFFQHQVGDLGVQKQTQGASSSSPSLNLKSPSSSAFFCVTFRVTLSFLCIYCPGLFVPCQGKERSVFFMFSKGKSIPDYRNFSFSIPLRNCLNTQIIFAHRMFVF